VLSSTKVKSLNLIRRTRFLEVFLKPEDIAETLIRIECQCLRADVKGDAKPLELRSETFQSLKEALGLGPMS
jgi:hypothetical protein